MRKSEAKYPIKLNDIYDVIDMTTERTEKYIYYYMIIKCKTCNSEKKVTRNEKSTITYCKYCNIQQYHKEFVGFENNMFKVIDFSHVNRRRLFYKVVCKICNTKIIMRKDSILDDDRKCCTNCRTNGVKPSLKGPMNVFRYYYMKGAKARNLEWTLGLEEFDTLVQQNCYYCNDLPTTKQHTKRYNKTNEEFKVTGIDRLDSLKGYTTKNCVSCCGMCNRMKMAFTHDDFISKIKMIYLNLDKCSTTIPEGSTL